jgi:hypothetical protein
MVRDEAPAATLRGFQRKWDVDRLECGLGHAPGFNILQNQPIKPPA